MSNYAYQTLVSLGTSLVSTLTILYKQKIKESPLQKMCIYFPELDPTLEFSAKFYQNILIFR